jgi:hypothetical protein
MLTALLVATLAFQEHAAWERFAPGSWVEHRTTGTREGQPVKDVVKTSLKDVTDLQLILLVDTIDTAGGRGRLEMKYPLPQRAAPKEEEGTRTGQEELTVDGKTFACEIRERRGVRRWICPSAKANGGVLKSEAISGTVKVLSRVLKLEEKVPVGSATVTCWSREDITDTGDQKTTRTHWISEEVPGGLVRLEVRQTRGNKQVEETNTNLTSFEVVKK